MALNTDATSASAQLKASTLVNSSNQVSAINTQAVFTYLQGLQARIVEALEMVDGKTFLHDSWQRPEGGGGTSCLLEEGNVFERAGVGFSHVIGSKLPPSASAAHPEAAGRAWEAMGVSLVFHPRNPYVPTVHMNVRFFVAKAPKNPDSTNTDEKNTADIWWFGGGFDLTPYYGYDEDCRHFHQTAKNALDGHGEDLYPRFKKWCDEYFYLKHRNEPRGIGGIFFDDFNALSFEECFSVVRSVGNAFIDAYLPILERRYLEKFTPEEKSFQEYRRGRYVEYNLIFDRGTIFGLQSGGRSESILMSMPPVVTWRYNWHPEPGTPEAKLYNYYLKPRNWLT